MTLIMTAGEFLLSKRRDGSAQSQTYFAPDLTALIEAYLDAHAAPSRSGWCGRSADARTAQL